MGVKTMAKTKKKLEMGMDIMFNKQLPNDVVQKLYETLSERGANLTIAKPDNSVNVDCARKGSAPHIAYLTMVTGFSDRRTQISALVGFLFSLFAEADDEDILKVILETILSKLEDEEDIEMLLDSVMTCRILKSDVENRVRKIKDDGSLDNGDTEAREDTPFWIDPQNKTLQ